MKRLILAALFLTVASMDFSRYLQGLALDRGGHRGDKPYSYGFILSCE